MNILVRYERFGIDKSKIFGPISRLYMNSPSFGRNLRASVRTRIPGSFVSLRNQPSGRMASQYKSGGNHLLDLELFQLQNYANTNRGDAKAVNADPEFVIRRFESGLYASNSDCRQVYLMALQKVFDKSKGLKGTLRTDVKPTDLSQNWQKVKSFSISVAFKDAQEFVPNSLNRVTFRDIKGCTEAKEELMEIVEFLRNPGKFTRLGANITQGVLLVGAPGTGKTLLARAVAGEANVPFFFCNGSEFDEMFVGVGASRIRKLFASARKKAPCIIFIDELDALGGKRSSSDPNYNRQTLNQFLVELDGFKKDTNVIVIGATNFPESLDKALVRSGRFDTQIHIPLPSYNDRIEIFQFYMNKVRTHRSVSAEVLAKLTEGLSGSDISNVVNQAAQRATVMEKNFVTMEDFDWACDRVAFGRERRSLELSDLDKKITAFHEAGHAITAYFTSGADRLHKATIVPRGGALGVTQTLPEKEKFHETYEQLMAHIDVCMGGRVAEELIFGKDNVTTGCSSDLVKATSIARAMVMQFGMNSDVGYISTNNDRISASTEAVVDKEVKSILDLSYARVKRLLMKHSDAHDRLAHALLKSETLAGEDLEMVILGKTIS